MEEFEIIIIGGGASGCICAIEASKKNKSNNIALIDGDINMAKKLLVTGNGKCNLSNINISNDFYNCDLSHYFCKLNSLQTQKYFEKLGLHTFSDEEGRIYPISNSAKSVVLALNNAIEKNNVSLFNEEVVEDFYKDKNKYIVITNKRHFICNKLIIATGGNTFKAQIENLNIKYNNCAPCLCALKTKENTRALDGVRVSNVSVIAKGENFIAKEIGEILFKENGISGICVFNLSCFFARQKNFTGKISINLFPKFTSEQLFNILKNDSKIFNTAEELLHCIINKSLALYILNACKINKNTLCNTLSDNDLYVLCKNIQNLQFNVVDCYNNNQIFSGGIPLVELNEHLESIKNKNLYFCGEICDVDAVCGGYNLQWAWTSGYIVGKSV